MSSGAWRRAGGLLQWTGEQACRQTTRSWQNSARRAGTAAPTSASASASAAASAAASGLRRSMPRSAAAAREACRLQAGQVHVSAYCPQQTVVWRAGLCSSAAASTAASTAAAGAEAELRAAAPQTWETCVGLEIHAQIRANSKAFSGAGVAFGPAPNTMVALFDAAFPGTLPVLNRRCVEAGVLTARALGMAVNRESYFDRKHYFYPDLPTGYQITQQRVPLAEHGQLSCGLGAADRTVRIARLHLEHDSAKSIHTEPDVTLIDLNRAGTGLMEIVTLPDLRSGAEAAAFVRHLILLLKHIGTCDGNLAEGSLRVDANISVRRAGSSEWGTRVEVKNINGLRFLSKAIEFEEARQIGLIEAGEVFVPETRFYDTINNRTIGMRSKEDEVDYRYMPEPDLPPLVLSPDEIAGLESTLPELPRRTVERLCEQHGIEEREAIILVEEAGAAAYFEAMQTLAADKGSRVPARKAAQWITTVVFGQLRTHACGMGECPASAAWMLELVELVESEEISGAVGRDLLGHVFENRDETRTPRELAKQTGRLQTSSHGELEAWCDEVLAENPEKAAQYAAGKKGLMGFFVGQVLKRSGGKANPKAVSAIITERLALA